MRKEGRINQYHDRIERKERLPFVIAIASIIIFFIVVGVSGCSNTQYVYVSDTIRNTDTIRLTTIQRDSLFVDRWHTIELKGDTILIKDSVWLSRYITKHDTIKEIADVEKVVYIPTEAEPKTKPLKAVFCVLFIALVTAAILAAKKCLKNDIY